MRVVVTGGAGFIGANVCAELIRRGVDEVVAVDDLSSGFESNLDGLEVDLRIGSILDPELLGKAFAGADSVIHLAARPSVPRSLLDPIASHEANATGTLLVLEAAREVNAHVAVASSSSVYGRNPELPKTEELMCMPVSPYAVSKLAAESYALAYQSSFAMTTLPFRFFNVYGPLQAPNHAYAAVVPAFVWAALHGQPLIVHGDGEQTRDFTFVDSVSGVLTDAALNKTGSDRPVNLAFGTRTSLNEVIALLSGIFGRELDVEYVQPRAGDVRDSQASNSRLRALFPGQEPLPLETGLRRTVEWMRSTLPA
jgi:UDP-glucose 4-epimerase